MAIGIVNDHEFEQEMEKLNARLEPVSMDKARVITPIPLGRGKGNVETPEVVRKIIGENALEEGNKSTEALASALGISNSSVSAYKNGATSTASYNDPDTALKKHMNFTRERISRRASHKLNAALSHITGDKLENCKAKDLASIAKDMSAVIKNMEPPVEKQEGPANGVNIVFMAPHMRRENQYETITVQE